MAPSFVEALSLSHITQLAANPPKYPRNPTEQARQPLILYIARVPGSRDVILTTLKPQLKNVTGLDVENSLYYIHLNTQDDARLLQEEQTERSEHSGNEPSANVSMQKPLPRKPLPGSARASLDIARTNSGLRQLNILSDQQPNQSISRRSIGPRLLTSETTVNRKPFPILPMGEDSGRSSHDEAFISRASMDSARDLTSHSSGLGGFGAAEPLDDIFSITIIRRDPSSGAQWTIGHISGRPNQEDSHNGGAKSSRKPYFDVSIDLIAPGYNSFWNTQSASHGNNEYTSKSSTEPPYHSSSFHRKIRMEGNKSLNQHRRTRSDLSNDSGVGRGGSYSGSSTPGKFDTSENTHHEESNDGNPSKGYLFTSPWGGRCKFSTGSSGRSLRCKHTLPNQSEGRATDSLASPQASAAVSELRFNLPSSTIFASSSPNASIKERGTKLKRFVIPKLGHIRNKLSSEIRSPPLPPRSESSSYTNTNIYGQGLRPQLPPRSDFTSFAASSTDEEESNDQNGTLSQDRHYEDRFGLTLGQEKAGGGNRGKRAKLGKLIIFDEGLKMLDLAVAANMGIWWSVWESEHQ